jgi:hypothetical protein
MRTIATTLLIFICHALAAQCHIWCADPFHEHPKPVQVYLHLPKVDVSHMNAWKWTGFALLAAASFTDGTLEGYTFDNRRSFERKYGADPYGFWGSQSWQADHTWWAKQFGVPDFYHLADDFRTYGRLSSGVCIGIGGLKSGNTWKRWAIDLGASLIISSGFKRAGMMWVRS